ncbi:sensor histidine kinase [Brevibacillus daliensis]|uniref:sensor histidine kinase n=1 Tax=Brevibacillus daliensis TaxID=2892995 RepID=UPI001E36D89A|nr:HAMP domain-containing sensor histidine kinase [Brevibacillus daliensis]
MKSKKIHSTLLWNYSIFIFFISTILILTLGYLLYEIDKHLDQGLSPVFKAKDIVQSDYTAIAIDSIAKHGGWVEIVNEQNQVVYVIGNKQDDIQVYSSNDLYENLDYSDEQPFFYSIAPFTTITGKPYLCLIKLPRENLTIDVQYLSSIDEAMEKVSTILIHSIFILLIPIIAIIFLYSRYSAKKISEPLKVITNAIKRMTGGDYQSRIALKAESEFGQIRDAFNYLADQLEATRAEKERLEESKRRMLMDISHDLKTPITSIQGYAKALQEGIVTDPDKKQRYLELIYNKSQSVTSLINSLFEFLTINDGNYNLIAKKYDLSEFMRQITLEYLDELEEKEFSFHVQLPEQAIYYHFDYRNMSRAVSNLLSNAIKYNPNGTHVRIALKEQEHDVVIEIADKGIGIPSEVKYRIFDPFVRGDTARQSDGGTGLGLSIAQKIVVLHGGTLELVENAVERTIFRITLPRNKE